MNSPSRTVDSPTLVSYPVYWSRKLVDCCRRSKNFRHYFQGTRFRRCCRHSRHCCRHSRRRLLPLLLRRHRPSRWRNQTNHLLRRIPVVPPTAARYWTNRKWVVPNRLDYLGWLMACKMDLEHNRIHHTYRSRLLAYWCRHCCCLRNCYFRNCLASDSRENKNSNPTASDRYLAV